MHNSNKGLQPHWYNEPPPDEIIDVIAEDVPVEPAWAHPEMQQHSGAPSPDADKTLLCIIFIVGMLSLCLTLTVYWNDWVTWIYHP